MGKYSDMANAVELKNIVSIDTKYTKYLKKTFIDYLDDTEREAYQEYFEIMISPKFNLSEQQAHIKATEIMTRNIRVLNNETDQRHFEAYGWVRVYSTKVKQEVYFVKDMSVIYKLPDKSLPVFTQNDIKALKGLDGKEMAAIMLGKVLFDGQEIITNQRPPPLKGKPNE